MPEQEADNAKYCLNADKNRRCQMQFRLSNKFKSKKRLPYKCALVLIEKRHINQVS
jgi:hypothetical protein